MTDLQLAQMYLSKARSARDRGIDFSLTFAQFKKLRNTKTCFYTGVRLTKSNFSIDRINAALPYSKDNSVACCEKFNRAKGMLENPNLGISLSTVARGLIKMLEVHNENN